MNTDSRPKAIVSWSSGKDSAFALQEILTTEACELVGVLTTVTTAFHRVSMHGVREELLDAQVAFPRLVRTRSTSVKWRASRAKCSMLAWRQTSRVWTFASWMRPSPADRSTPDC